MCVLTSKFHSDSSIVNYITYKIKGFDPLLIPIISGFQDNPLVWGDVMFMALQRWDSLTSSAWPLFSFKWILVLSRKVFVSVFFGPWMVLKFELLKTSLKNLILANKKWIFYSTLFLSWSFFLKNSRGQRYSFLLNGNLYEYKVSNELTLRTH
jgi:hypothetical protein